MNEVDNVTRMVYLKIGEIKTLIEALNFDDEIANKELINKLKESIGLFEFKNGNTRTDKGNS